MKSKPFTVFSNYIYILDKFSELCLYDKITIKKSIISDILKDNKILSNKEDYIENRLDYFKDKYKDKFNINYKVEGDNIIIFKTGSMDFTIRQKTKTIFSIL